MAVEMLVVRRTAGRRAAIDALARRIVGPITGLMPNLGFHTRPRHGTRVVITTGDLTGVHHLTGGSPVEPGSHHIGAAAVTMDDALIRTLAESIERYGHYAFPAHHRFTFAARADLDGPSLAPVELFDDEQFADPDFLFDPYDPDAPLGWWRMAALTGGPDLCVPAQSTLVGYPPRLAEGEPWLHAAVTTGSATHTDPARALLSAIQELVQLDATMGHWHTATRSARITFDQRTEALAGLIARYWDRRAPYPEFHLLPSPDLPGFTVACLIRSAGDRGPAVSVGLGADTSLTAAMHKALLEGTTLTTIPEEEPSPGDELFLDLEANVSHYARPENAHVVEDRFARCDAVRASDLPPDRGDDVRTTVRRYVTAFRATGKRLLYGDLTTPDVRRLGFHVLRVWSPETLPLCLPGAPTGRHPRYRDYGGYSNTRPHPYP
jgi:thiazole/oxazole-forming peptide maturase SagD family component